MNAVRLPRRLACTLLLGALATGCAGYRLGSMLPEGLETVHVPVFQNRTSEPFLETALTTAVREEIQKDGSFRLAGENDADAELQVIILKYDLQPLSYERENRTQANEYRVTLETSVLLRNRRTGETIVSYPHVRGDASFPFNGDLTSAKRQALPAVADDLAHQIVERVVEAW
jgi:hypothetical protein